MLSKSKQKHPFIDHGKAYTNELKVRFSEYSNKPCVSRVANGVLPSLIWLWL
jgi:hypothetical protein